MASLQAQLRELTGQLQALEQVADQQQQQVQMAVTETQQLRMMLTTKENELRLKGRELDLHQQELALKREQMLLDHEVDRAKVAIDAAEAMQNEATRRNPSVGRTLDAVRVNALRHHGNHRPQPVAPHGGSGCSTPCGINGIISLQLATQLRQLAVCSTPRGITTTGSWKVYPIHHGTARKV